MAVGPRIVMETAIVGQVPDLPAIEALILIGRVGDLPHVAHHFLDPGALYPGMGFRPPVVQATKHCPPSENEPSAPTICREAALCYACFFMQVSEIFLSLGEESFAALLRSISIGKLKTFQLYERVKARLHVNKLNSEALRKAAPRCWARLSEPDSDEYASEISQAILISHFDMIKAVLDFLGIPHEEGFFPKDLDASQYLTEGWQQRTYEHFKGTYTDSLLLFYINHLGVELGKSDELFVPHQAASPA